MRLITGYGVGRMTQNNKNAKLPHNFWCFSCAAAEATMRCASIWCIIVRYSLTADQRKKFVQNTCLCSSFCRCHLFRSYSKLAQTHILLYQLISNRMYLKIKLPRKLRTAYTWRSRVPKEVQVQLTCLRDESFFLARVNLASRDFPAGTQWKTLMTGHNGQGVRRMVICIGKGYWATNLPTDANRKQTRKHQPKPPCNFS